MADCGTAHGYWAGCRCRRCRAARAAYARDRRLATKKQGAEAAYVPAAATRQHLHRLAQRGLGRAQVSQLAGISRQTVYEIVRLRRPMILARTAARILAVEPIKADGELVSAWRTKKLLAAITAEGYTFAQIAQMLGRSSVRWLGRRGKVRIGTERAVEALYQRITGDAWVLSTRTVDSDV